MNQTKYKNSKVIIDNIKFDSKEEGRYYECLKKRFNAGELKFHLQPIVTLVPSFKLPCGALQRAITYAPDFLIDYADGGYEYVDIKGMATQAGILRRKLYNYLLSQLPVENQIPLKWIASSYKYGDADGWIDFDELQKIRSKNRREKTA